MAVMVNIRAWLSMLISEWWKLKCQDFFLHLQTIAKYFLFNIIPAEKWGPCMLSGKNTGSTAKKSNCQILINSFVATAQIESHIVVRTWKNGS